MLGHFQTLLESFITKPEAPILQLPLMTEAERHQLLEEWNDTRTDYSSDQCIHKLFEAQVERTPDKVAVVFRDEKLTYRELNQRANQLAHHLKRLGVGQETPVGIYVERSLEMVVGLLGILKAGGAYIPLDPIYPRERLAFMLEDARVSVLLTEDRLAAALPEHKAELVCLDTDWIKITREGTKNPVNRVTSDDIAYVLYTSGSTGKPKGVVIPHRAICNHMLWMQKEFGFDQTDRILQKTPFSFDASVWEFYGPLLAGGQLIMAQSDGHRDGNYLVETIIDQKITTLQLVPSQLQMLLDIGGLENCHSLQRVFCGGEALSVELVNRLVTALPTADLINLYGPTEATIDTTCWTYQNQPNLVTVPIGRPIANVQVYILDPDLNPVPIGVRGELYIGGAGVGRGYLNRPVLTTQKFIQDPFSDEPGARLYKTEDIARYLPDGNIEFLGRIDDQTKLRGYRIELGEIEVGLSRHPSVSEAIVVVREDTPGDRRLVAYIKPTEEAVPTSQQLRQALSQKLPEYMIPSTYIILDAWPLTPSGKIARQALPAPEQARPGLERVFVTPQDLLELQLTEIWEEVLDVQPVGIRDNFFELGGHSLLAVRLFAQIEEILDRNLPVGLIFQAPTVEQLAGMLRREGWSPPQTSLVPMQTDGPKRPLFFVPPAGNTVVGFADLIRNLGTDQPCYGLQPPTPNGRQTPFNRVEDLATHFIKEIRTIQPEGPYLLGGQCFGGQVVFEMAQQFRTEGQATALLALFDTPYPNPTLSSKISWHLEVLGKLESKEKLDYLLVKVKRRLAKMISRVYLKTGRPLPAQVQDLAAEAGIRQASNSYQPQRYLGQITLFRAGGEGFGEGSQDLERGWGHVAAAGVEVHLVPGTHREMMSEPHVQKLAEQLRVCLDQIQATDEDVRNDSI
jgi:aspartate racemase